MESTTLKAKAGRLMSRLRDEGLSWGIGELAPRIALVRELMEGSGSGDPAGDRADPRFQERILARAGLWCEKHFGIAVHDNQFAAALALASGQAIELPTGEGKTLAGALAAILIALRGERVLSLSINDYLAKRDHGWMSGLYDAFGLSHGSLSAQSTPEEKRSAYRCAICHAQAREAGFDRLKDLTALDPGEILNPYREALLLDEADVILLDEARLPLVLAGPVEADGVDLMAVRDAVEALDPFRDVEFADGGRKVLPSARGRERLCLALRLEGPHEVGEGPAWARIHAALHARFVLKRDLDYVLSGPESEEGGGRRVGIVDEISGRIAPSRRWPWGVQAAVEAREGAARSREGEILASLSMEAFVLEFPFRCGMSASLSGSAPELRAVYGMGLRVLEADAACARRDLPDRLFDTRANKAEALARRVAAARAKGQPVLIGTASVRESEELGNLLRSRGLPCTVLNAANAREEAAVIERAGDPGRITVSTSMAGRGTDIRLAAGSPKGSDDFKAAWEAGGLLVLGACTAESERMDEQLRGRAGRQGEPGESQFFLSLEDPFFRKYGIREYLTPKMLAAVAGRDGTGRGDPGRGDAGQGRAGQGARPEAGEFLDPAVLSEFRRSQRIIKMRNDETRMALRSYEAVIDSQYRRFSRRRRTLLMDAAREGAERRAALAAMDRAWADHLAMAADLRQGVHLNVYGGRDPWREYLRIATEAFEAMMEGLEEGGPRDPGRALSRPDQRWTYAIEENLLPSWRLGKGPGAPGSLAKFILAPVLRLFRR